MPHTNLKKILQNLKEDTVTMSIGLIKVNIALTALIDSLDNITDGYVEDPEDINNKIAELGKALSTYTDALETFEKHGRPLTEITYE